MPEATDAPSAGNGDPANPAGFRLIRTVALIGMMGCGKTAIGRELAQRLQVPFVDSDHEIETAANASISEIFARDGETFFREREAEVLTRLIDGPPVILSTGGGAWMQPRNRATIQTRGTAVWLQADLDLLWDRVRHRNTRPLLRTADPRATLADLLATREPTYRLADLTVAAERGLSIQEMGEKTLRALATRTNSLEPTT